MIIMTLKFFETLNESFIAHAARRLADLVNEQTSTMMEDLNLTAPSTSVSTLIYLRQADGSTAKELADALGVSHQMATQRLNKLLELQLVEQAPHPNDKRAKVISLSKLGQVEADTLVQFTNKVAQAFSAIDAEIGCQLSSSIRKAETLLIEKPLAKRIRPGQRPF